MIWYDQFHMSCTQRIYEMEVPLWYSICMRKVFVSGTYDIIHAGHIQFFKDARALGDHLTVSFASKDVIALSKKRHPSLPDSHKAIIIGSIRYVDKVVSSSDIDPVFDFVGHWEKERPDVLVVTEDDRNAEKKRILCKEYGVELVILPKHVSVEPVSTSSILAGIKERAKNESNSDRQV